MNTATAGTFTVDLTTVRRDRKGNNWRNALRIVKDKLAGEYDADTQLWTVTLDRPNVGLDSLVDGYGATVERVA